MPRRARSASASEPAPKGKSKAATATAAVTVVTPGATSVLDLVDDVNDVEREQVIDLSEPATHISTESSDFGTMLANLTRELDEEAASMPTIVNDGPISPSAHYRRVTADPAVAPTASASPPRPAPASVAARGHRHRARAPGRRTVARAGSAR